MSLFGDEVKRLREEKKLSQTALGAAIGITQGAVGHLETGRQSTVGADVLYKLCDALGVPCDHFRPFLSGEVAEAESPAKKATKGKKK